MTKITLEFDKDYLGTLRLEKSEQTIKDAIRRYNDSKYEEVKELIEAIDKTKALVSIGEEYRGFGKTSGLTQLAETKGVILLVCAKVLAQQLSKGAPGATILSPHCETRGLSGEFLVDTGVRLEDIKDMEARGFKLIGGFTHLTHLL